MILTQPLLGPVRAGHLVVRVSPDSIGAARDPVHGHASGSSSAHLSGVGGTGEWWGSTRIIIQTDGIGVLRRVLVHGEGLLRSKGPAVY